MIINSDESIKYAGGATSSAVITAFTNMIKTLYGIGQNLGSAIRRLISGTTC